MTTCLLRARRLITPLHALEPAWLWIEGDRIADLGCDADAAPPPAAQLRDFGDAVLAPGLIDIHVHGGAGCDLMATDPDTVPRVARHLARHGVTGFLPTTVTAPWPATLAAVARLAVAVAAPPPADGAQPLGLHLEGPFLSPLQPGVHPVGDLLLPTPERFDQLWDAAAARIALLTLAPELPGALSLIAAARARGVAVSLGHTDADRACAQAAIAAGARHVTHAFNAMRPLRHRDPGLIGEALAHPALTAEIIADGLHVDPLVVELFLRLKGPERAVLVSDGISAAGCGDGVFPLGDIAVTVENGRCGAGGRLAGSLLTLDRAARNAMEFAGWDLASAWRLASLNPARVAGLPGGELRPGALADIVVLTPAGEVVATFVRGREIA